MNTIQLLKRGCGRGIALAALASTGLAQSETATTSSTAANQETVVLDTFEVKDVPMDQQIMPTARPISSVLGDARSIIDTPRSVSSVNKDLMNQVRIKSFLDLQQFTSSVQSTQRYGLAATPLIRGDLSAVYYNGQQSKYTYNDVPVSFNGVEAMDIVKGSGGAVYGPQNYGSAGYVNFITKEPYFDKQHTELSISYGSIADGQTYNSYEFSIDNSGPISDKTAYRVSYLGRRGDGFYLDTKDETDDVFAAITHNFSDELSMRVWVQAYKVRFNDISGINKVTQDLIDNSRYTFDGINFIDIDANNVLSGPLDEGNAERYQAQVIFEKAYGPDAKLKNSSSYEDRTHDKYNPSVSYSQYVPKDTLLQNRTEYHVSYDLGSVENKSILGVDLKREEIVAYLTFLTETYAPQDLSGPRSAFAQITPFISDFSVPGQPRYGTDLGYFNVFGYGDFPNNQDTTLSQAALFYQHDAKFTDWFSAVAGARLDYITADTRNPAYVERATNTVFGPGSLYDQSADTVNPSFYGSLIFKPTPKSSIYFTRNETTAVLGSNHFGGVAINSNSQTEMQKALESKSILTEIGYKNVFLDNRLYTTVALYRQSRIDPDRFGDERQRRSEGIEFETVYQMNKNLYFLGNYTYQDITYRSTTGVITPAEGVSNWIGNARVNYKFDSGFGIGVGPQIAGKQIGPGTTTIPVQYRIDSTIFYNTKNWDFQVNIVNLTNEENWSVMDTEFDGGTIVKERPLSASFTARYRF